LPRLYAASAQRIQCNQCLHWERMASITIRRLDEETKARPRLRAAQHGRSMEEEARTPLRLALRDRLPAAGNLADAIRWNS
jgi:antitoxin FitA-like protein